MRPWTSLGLRLRRRLREGKDLVALLAAMVLAQALVPTGHPLGSDDLVLWATAALCGAAALRARALGQGAHPMLRKREDRAGLVSRRLALTLAPATITSVTLAAADPDAQEITLAASLTLLTGALRARGQVHGETAWRPASTPRGWIWAIGAALFVVIAVGIGVMMRLGPPWDLPARGLLLGLGFLGPSLLDGDPEHLWQRRAASRGSLVPVTVLLTIGLVFWGPALSWWLLTALFGLVGGLDFTQAYAVVIHVVAWAAALWPRPEPVAMACILHEVIPAGGKDIASSDSASPFERPPEGTLRVNPLRTRRTRLMHPWVVPVRASRIARLDDPVQPLWRKSTAFVPGHALGDARFEPDPVTRSPQWEVLSLYPRWDAEAGAARGLGADSAQSWSIVVMRAFTPPDAEWIPRRKTWRWDEALEDGKVQIIDPSTSRVELRDGDLILISAEGVAHGYELEIGSPLYDIHHVDGQRPPQIEDYVSAG